MIVFAAGHDPNQKSDDELLKLRISAKAELWNFLQEISDEIINWHKSKEELISEISRTSVKILHPHFPASELQNEVINVLDTFKIQQPTSFLTIHTDEVTKAILAKMNEL